MTSWSCPHLNVEKCELLEKRCVLAQKGCVLYGRILRGDSAGHASQTIEKESSPNRKKVPLGEQVRNVSLRMVIAGCFVMLSFGLSLRAATPEWSVEDKETWKKAVKRVVTTPPCCGACPVLSMRDGRKAYQYVAGENKSDDGAKIYQEHEKKFLEAFQFLNPSRYHHWFGNRQGENKNEK